MQYSKEIKQKANSLLNALEADITDISIKTFTPHTSNATLNIFDKIAYDWFQERGKEDFKRWLKSKSIIQIELF